MASINRSKNYEILYMRTMASINRSENYEILYMNKSKKHFIEYFHFIEEEIKADFRWSADWQCL